MANTPPVSGTRIPVKLPWKGATDNQDQFSAIKKPVADFFKFSAATKTDLTYKVAVKKKGDAGGTTQVTRRRRPGNRQRSVRVYFDPKKPAKISGKSYKSLQFAITPSVAINDVIEYFETGAGKALGVVRVVDGNSGQGYPVIQ